MSDELVRATVQLFESVDRKDIDGVVRGASNAIQSVDELSRQWLRGIDAFGAYIRQLVTIVDDVHTMVGNTQEEVIGDIGLVTCWIEQDYKLEGKQQHVSAPTTLVFRREDGEWKYLLLHSIPLPPEQ